MKNKIFKIDKNYLKGFIFGIILCISQINISIGLPIALVSFFLTTPKIVIRSNRFWLIFIVGAEIAWQSFVWLYFKSNDIILLFQSVVVFVILAALLYTECDINYVRGLSLSIAFLMLLDFAFNLITIILGQDPIGRTPDFRVSDLMPRMGGVFGHNFFSLNIGVIGLFSGLLLKNNYVILFALINIVMNGSLRSWIFLLLFGIAYLFVRYSIKFRYLLTTLVFFIIAVFASTIFAASQSETGANVLRVFAWTNSLEKIIDFPIYGNHNFIGERFVEGVSESAIDEYGIAESQYLQLGLHFGVFSMAGYFIIIFIFLINRYKLILHKMQPCSINQNIAIASIVIFADTWYGSIFGSVITTFFFGILFISLKNHSKIDIIIL